MGQTGIIKSISIGEGGFFEPTEITFSEELNCIIGARGTGKTTVLEALRLTFSKSGEGALRPNINSLLRDNLNVAPLKVSFEYHSTPGQVHVITKYYGEEPSCVDPNGERLEYVPTFPVSIYSTDEIEEVANDPDGTKKRALIDSFQPEAVSQKVRSCELLIGELRKNATQLTVLEQEAEPLREALQELPEMKKRLKELVKSAGTSVSSEFEQEQELHLGRKKELAYVNSLLDNLQEIRDMLGSQYSAMSGTIKIATQRRLNDPVNVAIVDSIHALADSAFGLVQSQTTMTLKELQDFIEKINAKKGELEVLHRTQQVKYETLREKHSEITSRLKERDKARAQVESLEEMSKRLEETSTQVKQLIETRVQLKSKLEQQRNELSKIREKIASEITRGSVEDTGENAVPAIKVEIVREGDRAQFRAALQTALQGSRLRYSQIVEGICENCRPKEFVEMVRRKEVDKLVSLSSVDSSRMQIMIDYLLAQPNVLLELESLWLEDQVKIFLNIAEAEGETPEYKEAARLSTGQKCTSILPILLLASNRGPLIIDQPENNLDNHYIFREVVPRLEAVKRNRQLIFVTHNPNIPVLAEAGSVIVLGSKAEDEKGVRGVLLNRGNVESTREEIISLLEGGREAFELRAQKYRA